MADFFSELKRRKVLRVAAAYVVSSWVLLQVADLLTDILELPGWAPKLIFLLLVVGFLPALILSWAYDLTRDGVRSEPGESRRAPVVLAVLFVAACVIAGGWWYAGKDLRWARESGMEELEALLAENDRAAAFSLARQIDAALADDQARSDVWRSFAWRTSIISEPEGADVYWRPYENPDAGWQLLGTTPLHDIHVPVGASVLRIEKEGYGPLLRVIGGMVLASNKLSARDEPKWNAMNVSPGGFRLFPLGEAPDDMVHVPGWDEVIGGTQTHFQAFFIGRFEVSNREFQEFVDAGGYERRDLWEFEFRDGESTLTFEQAVERFVDTTGRPGPSTWEAGTYREGEEDYPVTGVSWYEAAAYARFRGRELPTTRHWARALATGLLAWELPASNVGGQGLAKVGEFQGVGWTGTFDMAGNAREWCYNEAEAGLRALVGGAWDDAPYMVEASISEPHRMPPFDRGTTNGIRLMRTVDEASVMDLARRPIDLYEPPPIPEPVSDEVFSAMLSAFDYDRRDLNAVIEEETEFRHWTRQKISIDGEPGERRIRLYFYLPHTARSRYQAILFWPGASTQVIESVDNMRFTLGFLLRNGRAVALPVLTGMLERRLSPIPDWTTHHGRNVAIKEIREFRSVVDYLETRADIAADMLGYYGHSWGGRVGAMVLAVEPRIKAAVLNQAGINAQDHRDINVAHYLPRVTRPVLHFSGLYDTDFRFETSSKPFFERLGTPAEHKKHVVEETGHFVSDAVVKGETLGWFDRYLGPVD